jgi:RNA polymerase sigma-70 factor (ECF subfamily)
VAPPDDFHTMLVEILPRLRAYAIWLTRNRAAADDLLQETACRALRAQDQFEMGTNFTAWMFRILQNEFISSTRRAKRTPVPIDDLSESFLLQQPEQEKVIFSRQVIKALDQLRPAQRQTLELICAAGLSYEEAAAAINCSIGTVKSRLWRARRHMEELLHGVPITDKPEPSGGPDGEDETAPPTAAAGKCRGAD